RFAPVDDLIRARLGLPEPSLRDQPARERSVGEQANAVLKAERTHLTRRATIEQRERDLIGNDGNAVLDEHPQMRRVEIGDADMADQALFPQSSKVLHSVEIGGMLEAPPVKLHEI